MKFTTKEYRHIRSGGQPQFRGYRSWKRALLNFEHDGDQTPSTGLRHPSRRKVPESDARSVGSDLSGHGCPWRSSEWRHWSAGQNEWRHWSAGQTKVAESNAVPPTTTLLAEERQVCTQLRWSLWRLWTPLPFHWLRNEDRLKTTVNKGVLTPIPPSFTPFGLTEKWQVPSGGIYVPCIPCMPGASDRRRLGSLLCESFTNKS